MAGFVWFAVTNTAVAQQTLWYSIFQQGLQAYQQQDFDTAEKLFKSAVSQSQSFSEGDPRYVKSLELLALAMTGRHEFADAENTYQKVLAIKEKNFGAKSIEVATTMSLLGDLYQTEDKFKEAETVYKVALEALPPKSAIYGEKLQNLGACYSQEGNFKQAQECFEKAIEAETVLYGDNSNQVGQTMVNLCNVMINTGDYKQAEKLASQALTILKSTSGSNVVPVNACLNALAMIQSRLGHYDQAEALDKQVLSNVAESAGPDTVEFAKALVNLAYANSEQHKYAAAEPLFQKARSILEKSNNKLLLATTLRDIGELYVDQGRYSDAEPLLLQARALREELLGKNHPDIAESLTDLAYLYAQQANVIDAEASYKRALAIYKQAFGEKHADYAKTLCKLGLLYEQMHNNSDAQSCLEQALKIREQALPSDHPDIAETLNQLADFYRDSGASAKAEPLYRRLLANDERLYGKNDAHYASDINNLARVLADQGNAAEAKRLLDQFNNIAKNLPGGAIASPVEKPQAGAATPLKLTDKWALCIGISNFEDPSINLKYSAKDATDFRNFLVSSGNFKPDHVKLLIDKDATRQNIIDQLGKKWLGQSAQPDDLVMIYISSHGSNAMQQAGGTNFLVAYDTSKDSLLATGIPMQWLSQIMQEEVHSHRIFLILDVCHSGSAASGEKNSAGRHDYASPKMSIGSKGLSREQMANTSKITAGEGEILLCSSFADQVSWESKQYPNSVFTRRLIEGMQSKGPSTTFSQAFIATKNKVEEEVLRDRGELQTPIIKKSWLGDDISPLLPIR
jgi:tetratricopeptide (TPR) repeat protein